MKYRTLPNTSVTVSEVGFGLWTTSTGWWGEKSDDEATALLHEALDLGITTFDAADTYGDGRSEDAARQSVRGPARARGVRDQVRLRLVQPLGRAQRAERDRAGLLAEVRALRARAVAGTAEHRLRRRVPDAQRADGTGQGRHADRAARTVQSRRQDPHLGRRARARDRLAVGRDRSGAHQRAGRSDDLEPAREVPRRPDGRSGERVRHRTRRTSSACRTVRGCSKASTRRTPCSRRPITAATGRARG